MIYLYLKIKWIFCFCKSLILPWYSIYTTKTTTPRPGYQPLVSTKVEVIRAWSYKNLVIKITNRSTNDKEKYSTPYCIGVDTELSWSKFEESYLPIANEETL